MAESDSIEEILASRYQEQISQLERDKKKLKNLEEELLEVCRQKNADEVFCIKGIVVDVPLNRVYERTKNEKD